MTRPISYKQRAFVLEYLKDKNATQAAIRAGYSAKSAKEHGHKMLKHPAVKAFLDEKIKKAEEALEFGAHDVLRKLWALADVDLGQLLNPDGSVKPAADWPKGYGKLLSGITVNELFDGAGRDREQVGLVKEIKLEGRNPALTNLGRYFKLFTDKVEHSGKLNLAERLMKARRRVEKEEKA